MVHQPSKISVFVCQSEETKEKIYEFRYRIHTLQLKRDTRDVDHALQWISNKDDESAIHIFACLEGSIVGSCRINTNQDEEFSKTIQTNFKTRPLEKTLSEHTIGTLGEFVVDPKFQHKTIVSLLQHAIFDFCLQHKISVLFSLVDPDLIEYYKRLGYRQYLEPRALDHRQIRIPMALCPYDRSYLLDVLSPFALSVPSEKADDGFASNILWNTYTSYSLTHEVRPSEIPIFWAEFADALARKIQRRSSIIDGLTLPEVDKVLTLGQSLSLTQGQKLEDFIDLQDKFVVIIRGRVGHGRVKSDKLTNIYEVFTEGDTLGKVPIPRQLGEDLSTIALEDVDLILLPEDMVEYFKRDTPILATRLTMNMMNYFQERLTYLEEQDQTEPETFPINQLRLEQQI